MNRDSLKALIDGIACGAVSREKAFERLSSLDYEDLGFARLDHHRALRTGVPEVVFCQGKSDSQIIDIFTALAEKEEFVIGTRLSPEVHARISPELPEHGYSPEAKVVWRGEAPRLEDGFVAVLSAGTADIPVAEEAACVCSLLGSRVKTFFDVGIAGIHRLLSIVPEISGASCIVAAAGMEGTLPGVVAGLVPCPVIALPVSVGYGTGLSGFSALFTMLNSCAAGMSVVNIDNGFGAGYMAHKINSANRKESD